jgi:hypothetical protein
MAEIFNDQPILGVRLVADGVAMHNGLPVIGIVDATGETFTDNQRVLGIDVLDADAAIHNDQPVRGAVLIADGRDLYNDQLVIPVEAISGALA